ncbi:MULTISPECIES: hypothetical protein [Shewanella]|jgi:sarcosine oxidase delta subunit|uniref:Uncharacterized protein n=3 Tax=Shewanella putrefaciens TaxID=24 RepID=E6XP36_SHEP2|nr:MULTISPECIES: hypothetical protein [Shewanella]CAD6364855.1 hypothetical protein SHEWT2_03346 [Shewanella hafniensis]ABM23471.1 conserved hypothetical protein [Shewanella sp. W3-18-1]AVV85199.1 hypothetical protein SPWS13_3490 [Shewanella putrefaciens]MCA1897985.1 hypothetical protein [Shewanella putrefaciens]MCK7630758.1 hypothetical protein [Shewanella sp. JNE9-1]
MKFPVVPVFILILFTCFASAIWFISPDSKDDHHQTWSSFIYTHGYDSGKYKKTDNFDHYDACRDFARVQSSLYDNVPWECGLNCEFDPRKQGFQCKKMKNDN